MKSTIQRAPVDKKLFSELFQHAKNCQIDGRNIIEALREMEPDCRREAIEISYSLQSGSYTEFSSNDISRQVRGEILDIVWSHLNMEGCNNLLDCGIGEGTKWLDSTGSLDAFYGFDASFHRMLYCKENLAELVGLGKKYFIKANMMAIPFTNESVDAVVTMHAIEPNSDEDAKAIIGQIFGIARKLVIMFEPDYRSASAAMRKRMERHAYARNIWDESDQQPGFRLLAEGRLDTVVTPHNETSYRVFKRKEVPGPPPKTPYCSPINGRPLSVGSDCLIDDAQCFCFPRLAGLYCLAPEDAIFVGTRV